MTSFRDRVNHFVAPLAAAASMTACGDGPKPPPVGIPVVQHFAECETATDPLSLKKQAVIVCENNAFPVRELAQYLKKYARYAHEEVLFKTASQPAVPAMISTPFAPQARTNKPEMLPPEVPGVTMDAANIKNFADALKASGLEGTNVMLAEFNDKTVAKVSAEFGKELGSVGTKSRLSGTTIIGYKTKQGSPVILLPVSALSISPDVLVDGVKTMLKKIDGNVTTLGRS